VKKAVMKNPAQFGKANYYRGTVVQVVISLD